MLAILIFMLIPGKVRDAVKVAETPLYVTNGPVSLGDIPPLLQSKTYIHLRNLHPYAIKINRVDTSCGCTVATTQVQSLAPFQRGIINVSVRPVAYGEGVKTVMIQTDRGTQNVDIGYDAVPTSQPSLLHKELGRSQR